MPAIMEALGELKGLVIADVGAGTGLFSKALDEAVGADGKVGGWVGTGCVLMDLTWVCVTRLKAPS